MIVFNDNYKHEMKVAYMANRKKKFLDFSESINGLLHQLSKITFFLNFIFIFLDLSAFLIIAVQEKETVDILECV